MVFEETAHENFQNLPCPSSRFHRIRAFRRLCCGARRYYQIFDLGNGNRVSDVGIIADGTAVLVYDLPVGTPQCAISHICQEYEIWVNGVMVNYSPTAPNLVYDNGTHAA